MLPLLLVVRLLFRYATPALSGSPDFLGFRVRFPGPEPVVSGSASGSAVSVRYPGCLAGLKNGIPAVSGRRPPETSPCNVRTEKSRPVGRETGTVRGDRTRWFADGHRGPERGAGRAPGAVVLPSCRRAVSGGPRARGDRFRYAAADTTDAGQARERDAGPAEVARADVRPPRATRAPTAGMDGLATPDGRRGLDAEPLRTTGESTRS